MGALHGDEAREADAVFEDVIRQSFVVLLPGVGDFALARRYLHNYETGLRPGDALHLAIAGNSLADATYRLDKSMIKAGKNSRFARQHGNMSQAIDVGACTVRAMARERRS